MDLNTRLLIVALAPLLMVGCEKRVTSSHLQTDLCPTVSVTAVGRAVNFYRVVIDIEGHGSHELVSNTDMPGDESRYVLGLRDTLSGVDVLVNGSDSVMDLDLQVAPSCRVRTVRPNNAFKPKPLRSTKHMAKKACHALGSTTQLGLT